MSKPAPTRYRTTNWKTSNAALKKRGSLLIWLDKDMVWLAPKDGREDQHLVTILRRPHEMIAMVENAVLAGVILHDLTLPEMSLRTGCGSFPGG